MGVVSFQGQRDVPAHVRFYAKVRQTEQCWEWDGQLDKDGYGRFWCEVVANNVPAHRWAYQHEIGQVLPPEIMVCHSCDNRRCVRHDHLFEGTARVNNNDKAAKGRTGGFAALKGERHTQAKLTWLQVREIRNKSSAGVSNGTLSQEYNIDRSVISKIVTLKIWNEN